MAIRISASELHLHAGDILAQIRLTGERVIIERRGQPIAALVPMQDLEQLQQVQDIPYRKRSREEQLASLASAAAVQGVMLAQRKGKRLPSSAKAIRQMREERTRRVAGRG